jgi:hypothetical protein
MLQLDQHEHDCWSGLHRQLQQHHSFMVNETCESLHTFAKDDMSVPVLLLRTGTSVELLDVLKVIKAKPHSATS